MPTLDQGVHADRETDPARGLQEGTIVADSQDDIVTRSRGSTEILPDQVKFREGHDLGRSAPRRRLERAQLACGLVQNPVYIAVTLFCTERLGQFYRLVDHHAVRDFRMFDELVGPQAQDRALHRVDAGEVRAPPDLGRVARAVELRAEHPGIQPGTGPYDAF